MSPWRVVAYDAAWPEQFASASTEILTAVGSRFLRLEHIGSTSVPGLVAKPDHRHDGHRAAPAGRACRPSRPRQARLRAGRHGHAGPTVLQHRDRNDTPTHHLHVVPEATWATRNERLLRDHLRGHPKQARRYGELKLQLARDLGPGEAYTRAKTALIQELVDAARDALGLPRLPVWEE